MGDFLVGSVSLVSSTTTCLARNLSTLGRNIRPKKANWGRIRVSGKWKLWEETYNQTRNKHYLEISAEFPPHYCHVYWPFICYFLNFGNLLAVVGAGQNWVVLDK